MQVLQAADGSWQPNTFTTAVTYTSTTHTGFSYRPLSASSRPSTAQALSPKAVHNSSRARPASARESSTPRSAVSIPVASKEKLPVSPVGVQPDDIRPQITRLVHSKDHRSVSPLSEGSTGATPSPAQTPCSVLSRPSTAGRPCQHIWEQLWRSCHAFSMGDCSQEGKEHDAFMQLYIEKL